MNHTIKLIYFNVKGLAETSRILLNLAQVNFLDYRFPLEPVDPANYVFKRDEFDAAKKEGRFECSMGKVPILQITDKKGNVHTIPQSKAIERYIARRFGFLGANEIEAARIDAICECVRDIKDRYQKIRNGTEEEKAEYFDTTFGQELESLVKVFDNNASFCVGDKLSLADVTIYSLITQFYDNRKVLDVAGRNQRIRDIVTAVASRPEVSVWMQKRPQTTF